MIDVLMITMVLVAVRGGCAGYGGDVLPCCSFMTMVLVVLLQTVLMPGAN